MTSPDSEFDDLLSAIVEGDLDLEDPAVLRRLSEDSEFAKAVEEAELLRSMLERVGGEEREALRAAVQPAKTPPAAPGAPARRPLWIWAGPLIAAGLLVWMSTRPGGTSDESEDPLKEVVLADSDFSVSARRVSEGVEITWTEPAGSGAFTVTVRSPELDGTVSFEREGVTGNVLVLSPGEWPEESGESRVDVELWIPGLPDPVKSGSLLISR